MVEYTCETYLLSSKQKIETPIPKIEVAIKQSVVSTKMPKTNEDTKEGKKMKGQFYTVNSSYILDGLSMPPKTARCVIEPFAGKGDLLEWLVKNGNTLPLELYDIDPKKEGVIQRDTLTNPPIYKDSPLLLVASKSIVLFNFKFAPSTIIVVTPSLSVNVKSAIVVPISLCSISVSILFDVILNIVLFNFNVVVSDITNIRLF